jgi:translocator protein
MEVRRHPGRGQVMNKAIFGSLVICVASAMLEALLSGRRVKERFTELRFPRYSLPLWAWFVIGGLYYVVLFVLLYRLFSLPLDGLRDAALILILAMIAVNALWNYIFFRMRNVFLSFVTFFPYNLFALALFMLLLQLDNVAAWWLLPYLCYLVYASAWGYVVWKLNRP